MCDALQIQAMRQERNLLYKYILFLDGTNDFLRKFGVKSYSITVIDIGDCSQERIRVRMGVNISVIADMN